MHIAILNASLLPEIMRQIPAIASTAPTLSPAGSQAQTK
jgi:hypothetical protein